MTRLETNRVTKGNGKRVLLIKTMTRSQKLVEHSYINRCRGVKGSLKKEGMKIQTGSASSSAFTVLAVASIFHCL